MDDLNATKSARIRLATVAEMDATKAAALPLIEYFTSLKPRVAFNVMVGVVAEVLLNARFKPGSTPLMCFDDDIAPAIRKTIEINMEEWKRLRNEEAAAETKPWDVT